MNHEQTDISLPDTVLERLNKRNKDRQNDLDEKQEQRNKYSLQLEGEDYFAQTFGQRAHSIEQRIRDIGEVVEQQENGDEVDLAGDLTRQFTEIQVAIQELQRYLTTSTMFLTDFKVKTCQQILTELTSSCEEMRVKLLPKKKFGFSSKKNVVKKTVLKVEETADKIDEKLTKRMFSWTLSNRTSEYICLRENEVNGTDVTISNLENCFVELQGHAGSVQISNAKGCVFLCGPIARSLFAENCNDVKMALACQQLRLHSSKACRIYVHVTCRAIIEDCRDIEFGDYNYSYAGIDDDFISACLDRNHNNYTDVADFNWLSPDVPSPNWRLMRTEEASTPIDWPERRRQFEQALLKPTNNTL